jgi:Sulfotransferase family
VARLLPRRNPPSQPVFILGTPRSGTTLVFELLQRSPALASLPGEGHLLSEIFHPGSEGAVRGHELGPLDVARNEPRALYWLIDQLTHGRRYLDKTPRNSLRVPYLSALYPDPWFVFVKRDGRAAVSSLITGWRSGSAMFSGLRMPVPLQIEGYQGETWKFVIPRGWEAYARDRTLAEVCAFQWRACSEAILAARDSLGNGRWIEVRYEDLLERPEEEVSRLLDGLGLSSAPEVLGRARELDRHVSKAVTPPRPDKWRDENLDEIEGILPMIAATMERLGYPLERAP